MKKSKPNNCVLCKRNQDLTFHHLVPKKMHNKRAIKRKYDPDYLYAYGIWVCADCHKMIHKTFKHDDLAFIYNTKEKLLEHNSINRFVQWVKKQDKRVKR